MFRKLGQDIEPGDIIMFLGTPHRISEVQPYEHPTVPGACGIARASDRWGISLWTDHAVTVA